MRTFGEHVNYFYDVDKNDSEGKKLPEGYPTPNYCLSATLRLQHIFDAKYAAGKRDNFKRQKRKEMERKQEIGIIIYSQFELFSPWHYRFTDALYGK